MARFLEVIALVVFLYLLSLLAGCSEYRPSIVDTRTEAREGTEG
jgi:hypothetical protein